MMFLGTDYVISSLIWLTLVGIFVFAFRKKIFKRYYGEDESLELFFEKITHYLKKNYPKINFDLSIFQTSQTEPNPEARKYIITTDILNQFLALPVEKSNLPKLTPKELQWAEYVFNCEPNKDKLPPDWGKRKNALLLRDGNHCFRCSKKITLNTTEIHMLRPLEDGGKYHLENLIPVCRDCKKVLEHDPHKKYIYSIQEDLEEIATSV